MTPEQQVEVLALHDAGRSPGLIAIELRLPLDQVRHLTTQARLERAKRGVEDDGWTAALRSERERFADLEDQRNDAQ